MRICIVCTLVGDVAVVEDLGLVLVTLVAEDDGPPSAISAFAAGSGADEAEEAEWSGVERSGAERSGAERRERSTEQSGGTVYPTLPLK